MPDNFYCPLFNQGLHIEKLNQAESNIGMCCFQQTLIRENGAPIDFVNNQRFNEIRKHNAPIDECSPCVEYEKTGNQSYRQAQFKAFEQADIKLTEHPKISSLSIRCENICNLKCITCSPSFSRLWIPDYKKLGVPVITHKTATNKNNIIDGLDLSQVRLLHFQGGESLMLNEHKDILKKIKEQGDISKLVVSYNTNGTIFPDEECVSLWSETQMTKIYFSIDAIGDQFEYIRFPANWAQVEETMFKIRDLNIPPLWIELGITVSLANLFYLQDIIDWRNKFFSKLNNGDPIGIYTTFASKAKADEGINIGGRILSLEAIPTELVGSALEYLGTLSDQNISAPIIDYITMSSSNKLTNSREMVKFFDNMDKIRNTSWKNSLKKLSTLI